MLPRRGEGEVGAKPLTAIGRSSRITADGRRCSCVLDPTASLAARAFWIAPAHGDVAAACTGSWNCREEALRLSLRNACPPLPHRSRHRQRPAHHRKQRLLRSNRRPACLTARCRRLPLPATCNRCSRECKLVAGADLRIDVVVGGLPPSAGLDVPQAGEAVQAQQTGEAKGSME
ncbi:hypothetical protein P154DRAFT_253770 [Amniculicola lignicola CBS 123094]|uniref:Uncharacterized protein n=1 Tax=Amniculicola lignicola CBS 123094 TaxID=1392246 RepID=A0A6A5W970_9PLEO|nr:hypothetical protein P154DRAFT_253770 [Amniculicola lignicola CBS 123094]